MTTIYSNRHSRHAAEHGAGDRAVGGRALASRVEVGTAVREGDGADRMLEALGFAGDAAGECWPDPAHWDSEV